MKDFLEGEIVSYRNTYEWFGDKDILTNVISLGTIQRKIVTAFETSYEIRNLNARPNYRNEIVRSEYIYRISRLYRLLYL